MSSPDGGLLMVLPEDVLHTIVNLCHWDTEDEMKSLETRMTVDS